MNLQLQNYQNRHTFANKLARFLWNITWALLFRPTPRGNLFRSWRILLLKCFGAQVCWSSNVLPSWRIWQPWRLIMGEYSCLSERVDCYNIAEIIIGDHATISQDTFLCAASHDITSPIMELVTAPIHIEAQAWICARAIVMPGITIREGAVAAAGAVVIQDIEPWTVVGGNPAKFIKNRVIKNECREIASYCSYSDFE